MKIKLTDVSLLRRANSFTTGKESRMELSESYRIGHSPIRTQIFWVECTDVPLFVVSQLVRSHVGVQFFQRSRRVDRGGEDFAEVCNGIGEDIIQRRRTREQIADDVCNLSRRFDRHTPTDVAFIINAEALINMAHKRLCGKASKEMRELMRMIAVEISKCDVELSRHLVPQCVYRGGVCPERKSCGWIHSPEGRDVIAEYVAR